MVKVICHYIYVLLRVKDFEWYTGAASDVKGEATPARSRHEPRTVTAQGEPGAGKTNIAQFGPEKLERH